MREEKYNKVYLREVTEDDKDLLYHWCNDPQCRANSLNSEFISYETHCKWFERKLEDEDSYMYICMNEDKPAGQIRVDCLDGIGTISYSIAKEHRGMGLGYEMLRLLEKDIPPTIKKLHAVVKAENSASQKCFEKLRYIRTREEELYHYWKEKR